MPLSFASAEDFSWEVRKIAVVGPGIVGMPMAALLAQARIREGSAQPAKVVVVQRNSKTSGWKVPAINRGDSVIGGVEPGLDEIVRESVEAGILSATHRYEDVADADMILVSVQTDKKGFGPDYGPMLEALEGLAKALTRKPAGNIPIIVFESTLAPSSMTTVMREHFAKHGLMEGKDILLGNSPNRVMPGRLVERVASSDKLVAGLHPLTPKLIKRIYSRIVTNGTLHETNSMTAEVVKTLENAYRDVRIAFAAEVVRYCDEHDVDFFSLRDQVNERIAQTDAASADATAVPSGGILVPTIGVGGHCLPKDGILLWWRKHESGADTSASLILLSRIINDESPRRSIEAAECRFGKLDGKTIALLGTAYRFDSEDTRNSPSLPLARLLLEKGCQVKLHDPYVKADDQNLERYQLSAHFTNNLAEAVEDADYAFFCTGHGQYKNGLSQILALAPRLQGIFDGANLYREQAVASAEVGYAGIGRGSKQPSQDLVLSTERAFRDMETGVANELLGVIDFLNEHYADSEFNRVVMEEVRRLASTCGTGCVIAAANRTINGSRTGQVPSRLVEAAARGLEVA